MLVKQDHLLCFAKSNVYTEYGNRLGLVLKHNSMTVYGEDFNIVYNTNASAAFISSSTGFIRKKFYVQ